MRRMIQGRTRFKGDFQRPWQLTHVMTDTRLVESLVAGKMNDAFAKLTKAQVGDKARKRLHFNASMYGPDVAQMSLAGDTTLDLTANIEGLQNAMSEFDPYHDMAVE